MVQTGCLSSCLHRRNCGSEIASADSYKALVAFVCMFVLVRVVQPFPWHVEASSQIIREGDAYNVSCWADSVDELRSVCPGGVGMLYMLTHGRNLTVDILNATTVYHEVRSAQPFYTHYECLCDGRVVGAKEVRVGVHLKTQNFSCQLPEHSNQAMLYCSFNTAYVDVDANYSLHLSRKSVGCQPVTENPTQIQCNFNLRDDVSIKFTKVFKLSLSMRDAFARRNESLAQWRNFQFPREELLVLQQPGEDLSVLNRSSSSICLQWNDKSASNRYNLNIEWSRVLHDFDGGTWTGWKHGSNKQRLCLSQLPYPYHTYTITLKWRVAYPNAHWSLPFVYTFSTLDALPARPPVMWPTGYYLNPQHFGEVHIYWAQLSELEHNGPAFGYNVSVYRSSDSLEIENLNIHVHTNGAIIRSLHPHSESYTIVVRSKNAKGVSSNSSKIHIPQLGDPFKRVPMHLFCDKEEGIFGWMPPVQQDSLIGYTVYWCSSNLTNHGNCNSTLIIQTTALNVSSNRYPAPVGTLMGAYEWGVASNYANGGSGGINWLAWHQQSSIKAPIQSDWAYTIQTICVMILLCTFIFVVRKFRYMSDIKVDLPVGLQVLDQTHICSNIDEIRKSVLYPPVVDGNFKPLDIGEGTEEEEQQRCLTEPVLSKPKMPPNSGYICMQSAQTNAITIYVTMPGSVP